MEVEYLATEVVVDKCSNGHDWNAENTRWESSGSGGRLRRRCRQCRRDKKAQARDDAVEGQLPRLGAERSRRVIPEPRTKTDEQAVADFEKALDNYSPQCVDRPQDFSDWEEDAIPSPRTAFNLCNGCPLLLLCREAAHVSKPGWSVWGGETWVYEKIYRGGTA